MIIAIKGDNCTIKNGKASIKFLILFLILFILTSKIPVLIPKIITQISFWLQDDFFMVETSVKAFPVPLVEIIIH